MKILTTALISLLWLGCAAPDAQQADAAEQGGSAKSKAAVSSTETLRYTINSTGLSLSDTEDLSNEIDSRIMSVTGWKKISSRIEAGVINYTLTVAADDEDIMSTKIESVIRSTAPRATFQKQ